MREFSDQILKEITQELNIIWQAHARHKLEGEMRVFTTDKMGSWESHQQGLEMWFGPNDVDEVVEKIATFYRKGERPNTVFLLDPIVYKRGDSPVPMPVGSGVIWGTVITKDGEKVEEETAARIHSLGIRADYLHQGDNRRAGLKILGLLDKPAVPDLVSYNENGTIVSGCKEIYDLADIDVPNELWKNYLLSGIEYAYDGKTYQHPKINDLFGGANTSSLEHTGERPSSLEKIIDASRCWNAYDRTPALYERYGIDVANLEKNLESKFEIDRIVNNIKRELALIWAAHKIHGLDGKMRVYSEESQEIWRSKKPGLEFWFGIEEMDDAILLIKQVYNGGLLPNTTLLLDPIVYKQEGEKWVPVGSGIAWATALCTGQQKFEPEMAKRIKDIGAISGKIDRGGAGDSGLKIIAFLDKPQLPVEGKPAVPGCYELFNVSNANGQAYWPYYILSGIEYLCGHGSFINKDIDEILEGVSLTSSSDFKNHSVSLQKLQDASKCWDGYDHFHRLWNHFGIDATKLEENLKYFNLVARDFDLLDATNAFEDEETEKLESETFNFIVDGWIPKGAVTLIAAAGGTGKSSAAHNLCVLAGIDYEEGEEPPLWLGGKLNPENCEGMCIYFSGEDGPAIVNERAKLFDPAGRSRRVMFQRVDFGENEEGAKANISEFLDKLRKLPQVPIIVIDPARKYLTGDENDSEVVSEFFEAIENFAIEKNTAMVVVHHLQKGAKPDGSEEVLAELRGSQVFIDRPRVIIGMSRDDDHTIVGLSKCNIPPSLGMVRGDRVFTRNPKTLQLEWVKGAEGIRRNAFTAGEELKGVQEAAEAKKNG
jgi:hypothetical protein